MVRLCELTRLLTKEKRIVFHKKFWDSIVSAVKMLLDAFIVTTCVRLLVREIVWFQMELGYVIGTNKVWILIPRESY